MSVPPRPAIFTRAGFDSLASELRIAVIYGGDKRLEGSVLHPSRNFRPWKSYESVARDIQSALERLGFRHVIALPETMALPAQLAHENIQLAWLNTGGVQGSAAAGHAAALLEMLGVPYIGHGPVQTMLLDTKDVFKRQLESLGIPTAPFVVWHPDSGVQDIAATTRFRSVFRGYAGPFIVKPVSGRASLHVHVVETSNELASATSAVYELTHAPVIVEKFLPGREFTVAVSGPVVYQNGAFTRDAEPFAFSVLERVLDTDEPIFTSMDTKPITPRRLRPVDTPEPNLADALRRLGRRVYSELGLHSIVRADIRADEDGTLNVLEVNPKPDLKQPAEGVTSFVAAGLAQEGMSYDDLILSLLADRLDYLLTFQRDTFPELEGVLARHLELPAPARRLLHSA
jgi:D-alanine-D-alanine ligase